MVMVEYDNGGVSMRTRWGRRGALLIVGAIMFILSLMTSASVGAYWPPRPVVYPGYVYPRVATYPYYGYYGGLYGYSYTDNRFCGDGRVTATPNGYFCTTTGVPAYRSDGAVSYTYVGAPYVYPYYYVYR